MLIKKELQAIPVKKIKFNGLSKLKYPDEYINSYIEGKYLVADFYTDNKELARRFFSDGQNGLILENDGSWNNRIINNNKYISYSESKESFENTQKYLNVQSWKCDSENIINDFISSITRKRSESSEKKKCERMKEHIAMFPGVPDDFTKYCEDNVFDKKYIVFENNKKETECQCLYCGKKFKSKVKLKHKQNIECPKCKSQATAIAKRYQSSPKDKAKICIMNKIENDLITVWLKVERSYSKESTKPILHTAAYYYDVLINNNKRYYYKHQQTYCEARFIKTKYSNIYDHAYVYVNNIESVYENGINPYGVDYKKLKEAGPVDLIALANNSKATEITKKLYKLKLYRLAENATSLPFGTKFEEVLGVNKAYLPILQKYNITKEELEVLKLYETILNPKQIEKFINLVRNSKGGLNRKITQTLLELMTFEKMLNYFTKQLATNPKIPTFTLFDWYKDYIGMSNELNDLLPEAKKIDMTATILRYPRDIKKAHDGVSAKLSVFKNMEKNKKIKALSKKYTKEYPFKKTGLLIKYPEGVEGFINEGATLCHCVGNNSHYANDYADEKEITVFVRKKKEPEKPYYTATFYTKDISLRECYGKNHDTAPKNIKIFLESYAKFMKEKYLKDKTTSDAA